MAGIMEGGLLGLIINGVQNIKEGLPFLARPEERVGKQQMDLEARKEQFKTDQDMQKAGQKAVFDILTDPNKQTTEALKWVSTAAPKYGVDIDTGTLGGMYGQAYDRLTNIKLGDQVVNKKLAEAGGAAPTSTQDKVITPSPASNQSLYQPTHPQTELVKQAIAMNESGGEINPYQVQERAKGGRAKGKYQFEPDTWNQLALEVGPMVGRKPSSFNISDPVDQETLATYEIDKHLNAGRTPEQVAIRWQTGDPFSTVTTGVNAQGVPYDVPAYVDRFKQNFAQVQQQYAGQQGQGSQGITSAGTPLPPHNPIVAMPVNSLQGMDFTRTAEGRTNVHIDGSKLQPTEEQLLMQYLDVNPALKQAYVDAKVSAAVYGTEPILFTPIVNMNGTPGIQMTRKKDGAYLGTNWAITPAGEPIKTKLSPDEEIEQAGKQAAKIAASTPIGKAIGENTPIASLEGKTPIEISDQREIAKAQKTAENAATAKRASDMVPLKVAVQQIKDYSKKVHTQKSFVGSMLNGFLQTASAHNPTGSDAKTYNDLSDALVGHIARVFGGERGVLTNQDWAHARPLIVGLFASKTYAEDRFRMLDNFVADLAKRPAQDPKKPIKGNLYPNSQGILYEYMGQNEKGEHGYRRAEGQ
ncbi:MAG: hypothetical protein WC390_08540 [Sulfurimonas sp.]|jgi:hypothetical protein